MISNSGKCAFLLPSRHSQWRTGIALTSTADIRNFCNGTGTGTTSLNNAGITYMPTASGNVGGGIAAFQLCNGAS